MECICYALQLDFVDDHTTVHHAVEVYCSWLEIVKYLFMNDREESNRGSQGYQDQLSAIPLPIRNNPEPYRVVFLRMSGLGGKQGLKRGFFAKKS